MATTRAASSQLNEAFVAVHALALSPAAESTRATALDVAHIVRALDADDDVVVAAMLQPLLDGGYLERATAETRFGTQATRLASALGQLGEFGLPADWTPERGLESGQAEALRKMLLAVIGDVRLVVVKLAAQLQKMRAVKSLAAELQRKLAIETREVYAPLANRLGVWQLKWELEDLAFRYLEPTEYKHVAAVLNVRRAERERYIDEMKTLLQTQLQAAGIEATVEGRPKHIYSIWRKMRAKHLAFEQLMDIRAARVLVNSVAECYAALGVVHSLWQFIHGEFDDYIATPKDNLYRSIHTAVMGPGNQPVEIQIRTYEMHSHSEHGVAAHWRYKEGGRGNQSYERKIAALRTLLAPGEGVAMARDFLDRMRIDLFQDRIYTISPKGEIVEVAKHGTPLDFAYQVHTELGHRTRGAKVNGRMVSLDYRLRNSDAVEIITAKTPQPSRDWLAARSGYIASPRHRAKVRAWFRKQDDALGLIGQIAGAIPRAVPTRGASDDSLRLRRRVDREPESDVQGIGDLLSTYAKCCKPVPPQAIAGYITVGRGVSIHSRTCGNLARLGTKAPERLLAVTWDTPGAAGFAVAIAVEAYDRRGLVRDVSAALADAKISIQGMHTVTEKRDNVANMRIHISISGLTQLSKVLSRISQLPNIISARRLK